MFRFQFRRMVHCREFKVALLASILVACVSLLRGAWSSHIIDASRILPAGEMTIMNGNGNAWTLFSIAWPFLAVLPFATSFVSEKKDQIVVPIVSRGNYRKYMVSKVLMAGFGSMIVICGVLLAELLACYAIYPARHGTNFGGYQGRNFVKELTGMNLMYRSCDPDYWFVGLYLDAPLLCGLVYVAINGLFTFLCGSAIGALSLCVNKSKVLLFLPLYLATVVTLKLRTILLDRALGRGSVFTDLYWMDYLAPISTNSLSWVYAAIVCGILAAVTIGCTTLGIRNGFRAVQG